LTDKDIWSPLKLETNRKKEISKYIRNSAFNSNIKITQQTDFKHRSDSKNNVKSKMQIKGALKIHLNKRDLSNRSDIPNKSDNNCNLQIGIYSKNISNNCGKITSKLNQEKLEDISTNINWGEIHNKLPIKKTLEDKVNRIHLFNQFDKMGNGYLSLLELDKGVKELLCIENPFDV